MIIRKAKFSDAEFIVDINVNGWKKTYINIFSPEFLNNLGAKRNENIIKCKNKINEYVVCLIDEKIVGFLRWGNNKKNYEDKFAEIYSLYVDAKYQKRGIGKMLLEYTFELLKGFYSGVLISTLQENSANEFYIKCGGKKIGVCDFELGDNVYKENLYLFKLNNK